MQSAARLLAARRRTNDLEFWPYTIYNLLPTHRYTRRFKSWVGGRGSMGRRAAHQSPAMFTADGSDTAVDSGSE
jgi:hypothetical protein